MRLGIFGGAFDPVHNGHLLLAEQCREQCRLDAVWFVRRRFLHTSMPARSRQMPTVSRC